MMMDEGLLGGGRSGGLDALAQQFFADLTGTSTRQDVPPEKSDQTVRIKISSTPWVIPTAIDRRFAGEGQETVIPKLQRLSHASSSSPFAGVSPTRSPLGVGGEGSHLSTRASSVTSMLDPFRQPSRDADRFDLPVRITEDPSVLPIQPPATPVAREVPREPASMDTYMPATLTFPSESLLSPTGQPYVRPITATPGKQIFKSPPPTTGQPTPMPRSRPTATVTSPAPVTAAGFLSPSRGSMQQQQQQPQSVLKSPTPTLPSMGYAQPPPSSTRKRVTFSAAVEDTPFDRGSAFTPQPRQLNQQSFLSPYAPAPMPYQ